MSELIAPELPQLIAIARIARPQGIRGEVVADVLTDFPERFATLKTAVLAHPNGKTETVQVERARLHQQRVIIQFQHCTTRNQAESLRDVRVMVEQSELLALPVDNYYDFDLVGCQIVTTQGETLGTVANVQDYGAAPLLAVLINGKEVLIPLASSICLDVNVEQKRIVVALPDGLLDL